MARSDLRWSLTLAVVASLLAHALLLRWLLSFSLPPLPDAPPEYFIIDLNSLELPPPEEVAPAPPPPAPAPEAAPTERRPTLDLPASPPAHVEPDAGQGGGGPEQPPGEGGGGAPGGEAPEGPERGEAPQGPERGEAPQGPERGEVRPNLGAAAVEREALLHPPGTGPVTGEALKQRVAAIARLDAQVANARAQADRGLAPTYMVGVEDALRSHWKVDVARCQAAGLRPVTGVEHYLPEGREEMAPSGLQRSCSYSTYRLSWVSVRLGPEGQLLDVALYRSSGAPALDQELLAMVRAAAPFPVPPSHELRSDGTFHGTWELGVRDYRRSNCVFGPDHPKEVIVMAWRGAFY